MVLPHGVARYEAAVEVAAQVVGRHVRPPPLLALVRHLPVRGGTHSATPQQRSEMIISKHWLLPHTCRLQYLLALAHSVTAQTFAMIVPLSHVYCYRYRDEFAFYQQEHCTILQ